MDLKQRKKLFAEGLLLIAVPVALLLAARLGMPVGAAASRGLAILVAAVSLTTVFAGLVGVTRLNASRAGSLADPMAAGAVFFSLVGVAVCALAAAAAILSFGSAVQPGAQLFGGR
jgi:hypothetical protein